jgi:hypothetical protein
MGARLSLMTCMALATFACEQQKSTPVSVAMPNTVATPEPIAQQPAPEPTDAPLVIPPLRPGESAPDDEPDYFDPTEVGSGAIVALIETCKDSAVKSEPTMIGQPAFLERYCACTADAVRKNKGKRELNPQTQMPSWAQLRTCADFAKATAPLSRGTPFATSAYDNSAAVATLYFGCRRRSSEEKRRDDTLYCSCYVDAMRSHKRAPVVTADEAATCEQFAAYTDRTEHLLTPRQFAALAAAMRRRDAGAQ